MTDHDQDAAIGALTKRYSDAKRKRAALLSEVEKVRQVLDRCARALQSVSAFDPPEADKVPRMFPDYPDPQVLAGLLTDLTATCHAVAHTQRLLKDAGIDVP